MQKPPQMEWKKPVCMGESPSRRSGHSFCLLSSRTGSICYVFGGCNEESTPPGPSSELFKLELPDYYWKRILKDHMGGDAPPARWHHTANNWAKHTATPVAPKSAKKGGANVRGDSPQMVVYGGFSGSKDQRYLNDLWLLDSTTDEWSLPPPLAQESTRVDWLRKSPIPRGSHTTTIVQDTMYLFGGNGGTGFARRDFNDVHALNMKTWEWTEIETKGELPEPRSGHQTAYIPGKLVVMGGWNNVRQFDDCYLFDLATSAWSHSESASGDKWGPPRWNHTAVSVFSVPNWKAFVFGGNSGDLIESGNPQGTYLNDVCVLDSGSNRWIRPETIGDVPSPRADTQMAFDDASGTLIIFGGWCNRWYNDVCTCKVTDVVGPPYNIDNISPEIGPITGGTHTIISGIGFKSVKGAVTVRYACVKGFVEVQGDVLSDNAVSFRTPCYEKYGPVDIECRVGIGGKALCSDTLAYRYFSVSNASQCIAFGPALMDGCVCMTPVSFIIEARDANGGKRVCGMDDFLVCVKDKGGFDDEDKFAALMAEEKAKEEGAPVTGKGSVEASKDGGFEEPQLEEHLQVELEDMLDGTYMCTFTPQRPARYEILVNFMGSFDGAAGPIRGSPFVVATTSDGGPEQNDFDGPLVIERLNENTKKLKDYCNDQLKGLRTVPPPDSREALVTVKEHLRSVEMRADELALLIDSTRAALRHLKGMGSAVDRMIDALAGAEALWHEVLDQVPITEQAIVPLTRSWSDRTEDEVGKYNETIEALQGMFRSRAMFEYATGPKLGLEQMEESTQELSKQMEILEQKSAMCSIFGFPELIDVSRQRMKDMQMDMDFMKVVWKVTADLDTFVLRKKDELWRERDLESMEYGAKAQMKVVQALPKEMAWCDCQKQVTKNIKDFQNTIPLIGALGEPCMRPRHWTMLQRAAKQEFTPPHEDPDMLLGGLLALGLHNFVDAVEEIHDQADKEAKMEAKLGELEGRWQSIEWHKEDYKGTDVPLLKIAEDDFEALEADQLTVQGIMASRFLAQFEVEVTDWQKQLATVTDVFGLFTEIQKTWSYLEPLFIGSEEVKRELPEDAIRFAGIDVDVKDMLRSAWGTLNIKAACNIDGLYEKCEGIVEQLDLCKKSLADFLDGRRRQFPRYYFTSEADLLDILSNGSTPSKIVVHTPKIYLMTKTFELSESVTTKKDDGEEEVTGVTAEGRPYAMALVANVGKERMPFIDPIPLDGKVEIYMQTILDYMKSTIFKNLLHSIDRYALMARSAWVNFTNTGESEPSDPAQIVLLVLAVYYVREVEVVFEVIQEKPTALSDYSLKQIAQLEELIKLTGTDLSKGRRQRVMVCITMDAHARDIVQKMMLFKVDNNNHFQWQSQLKHKFRVPSAGASFVSRDSNLRGPGGERAEVAICDAILPYDYEYLGNGFRLVITPLTDRIYVTATQALNLKMGCAPAGPAGTGKTETTKDLANALAKVCYVVNCSPEMDFRGLGDIFKGVASSGAWICFDEFNRLIPEVLSVCTVQFKSVCDGCKSEASTVTIEGDDVRLDPTCGAFITMNPGYLGRSELPEGLKALFRPMTVMVPDLVLICENFLMAEGFVEAKILASKFYGLYSLLSDLLSKQLHYDWGLRAVKSVLVVAGSFKRAERSLPEEALLMRALRDFNIPKIVREDEVVFFGLLGDLFPFCDMQPRTNPERKVDKELEEFVTDACLATRNHPDEQFRLKCVQFDELLAIRHCVFLMGPAGAGKTQCWKTLAAARLLRGDKTKVFDLNPKAVKTEELYGYISMSTREWKDGLLSSVMRSVGQIQDGDLPKWIMLDGDLDANWIESMNSVMDDNRMLTLASNERIPLKIHMRMVFEIRDLKHATPATVSRAGILYISTADGTQWRSLISAWLDKREDGIEAKVALREAFDKYVASTLFWMKINVSTIIPLQDMNLVQSLLFMLDSTLTSKISSEPRQIETWFVYCAIWAFGSALTVSDDGTDNRKIFSDWWRSEWKGVKIPSRETVFDYWLDADTSTFDQWTKSPFFYSLEYETSTPMASVTVPTPETCSVTFWMQNLVSMMRPVMLAGPAGTGKTQMVNGLLAQLDASERISSTINFNFYTTSAVLQTTMSLPLEKKSGVNFGPPGQKKLVYFVDDINLPEVDAYNTQSAVELLRQHMEYEHVYDLSKLSTNPIKHIANTQVVSCMNPTAGSFEINPRLQRWFALFAIGLPGPTSLLTIYQTFLAGHLRNFEHEVKGVASNTIKAALGLHTAVSQKFRKTAANFHYEFNIRHISNVFQGLLVSSPEQFNSAEKFAHLWLHESERVYGDRLVSPEDLAAYNVIAQAQSKKCFGQFNVTKFYSENADPLVFCHFAENIQDKLYDQIDSVEHMSKILTSALHEYNETNATMDLVLFEDAMKHVARITRIVLNEGGHALLVGVGGMGKQSLTKLASFICDYSVKQIVISATYGINDLKDDLKEMYNKAGLKDEGVSFLLTDSQITNERFLIFINDLLASGNIPDLFASDEVDAIVGAVTNKVKALGLEQNKQNCWDYFISRIRNNLHVVLAFSPVGDDFRNRAKKFPALVNCTVIDWFQPWPYEALMRVGQRFMKDVDLGAEQIRNGIEKFLPVSFLAVNKEAARFKQIERRFVYTTPKSYLELLKLYNELLAQQRAGANAAVDRLDNGLKRLRDTANAVVKIEADLKVALEGAEQKKAVAEGIAEKVGKEKVIVEGETAIAEEEGEKVAEIQKTVSAQQASCQADLAKAEPAVEEAMKALDTLDKRQLSDCKGMLTPPVGVDNIFISTMVLLASVYDKVPVNKTGKVDKKQLTWDGAKKHCLGNIQEYIEMLKYTKELVDNSTFPAQNMKEIRTYLADKDFNVETIQGKNSAAGGLCGFVINIVTYYDIVITVEPKRKALAEANETLSAANAKLSTVQAKVKDLQEKLAVLVSDLAAAEAEKADAIDTVERGQRKADLANRLTTALAAENERWAVNVEKLKVDRELLTGDVLLAAAFISYVGPFTKPFRDNLMNATFMPFLQNAFDGYEGIIPISELCDPLKILTTGADVAQWNSDGLPADQVSSENGAILTNSKRWSLIIDPQLQGIRWLRNKESDPERHLEVIRLSQNDVLRKLTRALENGYSIIIENLGNTLDAVLNPVIQRATIKRGRTLYVKLGDTEVEFHPDFRLYLHTKLSNPHYPPEIQAETTLINFTVTKAGLEDQMLVLVVGKERRDLADLSEELVRQQNGFLIQMKKLEDSILKRLANAKGDITEDVRLIEGLEETKKISIDISKKSTAALKTQEEIKITSEKYRPVANRTALLFFLMNDLVKIHTYYIYSLAAFTAVFYRGIDAASSIAAHQAAAADSNTGGVGVLEVGGGDEIEAEKAGMAPPQEVGQPLDLSDEQLAARCDLLTISITTTVHDYVRRGLFVRDKLTVAALLTLQILVNDGKLLAEDVEFLVVSKIATDPGNMGPLHEWLPEAVWPKVRALEGLKRFQGLGDNMQSDSEDWLAWFDSPEPEAAKLPGEYQKTLDEFERLILLRAMRPDRVTALLSQWIAGQMGRNYVEQAAFDMAAAFKESAPQTPFFFVLFPGVDPTPWVESLGAGFGISTENGNFRNISMGQGQEKPAETILSQFARVGGWAMLQNCHLMQSWVPKLERLLEIVGESAHESFRCFISAEPPPIPSWTNMPESLMQSCIKVANEAPADIKSNLMRAWGNFGQSWIDASTKPTKLKGCLFTLCWFHSIVLGRRRFGQQGWSRKYSFNTGDLIICGNVLTSYLDANPTVPWDDLRYIFGEIMYGGHITDAWDRRTANTYLEVLFTPGMFEGSELAPNFKAPDTAKTFEEMFLYIDTALPEESPRAFGLHPNAEIGYLTEGTQECFNTILNIRGGAGADGDAGASPVRAIMEDLTQRLPVNFVMVIIDQKAKPLLDQLDVGPFVVVALQECERMNVLLTEMRRSLLELDKGLKGQLNMSDTMEDLVTALSINQWPGRNPFSKCSWQKLAWPSMKNLVFMYADMLKRITQLDEWSETLERPLCLWLPGLFNPTAYLTAVSQVTGRQTKGALDKMTTETHVTLKRDPKEVAEQPQGGGVLVHGLYIEGARWPVGDEVEKDETYFVGNTPVGGSLVDGRLKELLPLMPIFYCKAVLVQSTWEPSAVGYLRHIDDVYECPVYITQFRGPTYVFLATLKTLAPKSKWVLTGTAVIMQASE